MAFRYFIEIQYNGKNYHGWQLQPNARTVQSELNQKLSLLIQENIETVGAGRTDTGVHASYFVAHFDCVKPKDFFTEKLFYKLNCILPNDISVTKIASVPKNSHARFDALSRTYHYYIARQKDVFRQESAWHMFCNLNIEKMNRGGEILMEYDDFTSFSKIHTQVKTNICKIMEAYWKEDENSLYF